MDSIRNPYSPGAGRAPSALAGREGELQNWSVALARTTSGRHAQSVVLSGLRGVGKTVLLARFADLARDAGWIVAQVEARSGASLRRDLGEALYEPLRTLNRPGIGRRVLQAVRTALSFKASYDSNGVWRFGLDLDDVPGGGADTGDLDVDLGVLLRDLAGAAAEEATGVAVLIDEAQDLARSEMTALCAVVHAAGQRGDRLLIALAGLPSLPRVLAEAKSYAERLFVYLPIGPLAERAAAEALVDPAREEGVAWDADARRYVLRHAAGYPYFIQQFGQDTWNVATEGHAITHADAREGVAAGLGALDNGFFRARWDRATPAERQYLAAMAQDRDGPSASGAIGTRLGRSQQGLGPIRAKLIGKGLIYAPEHGAVAFTVPGMADFIRRQDPDLVDA